MFLQRLTVGIVFHRLQFEEIFGICMVNIWPGLDPFERVLSGPVQSSAELMKKKTDQTGPRHR
jgi:hypothetical protein